MLKAYLSLYYPLISGLASLGVSQCLKMSLFVLRKGKIDRKTLFAPGGMPSSHTSMVCGLTTALGLHYGWHSFAFAIGTIFSLVVIYDAAGVRQAVGHQAAILNRLRETMMQHPVNDHEKLTELMGHTPSEIFTGAILGVLLALLLKLGL